MTPPAPPGRTPSRRWRTARRTAHDLHARGGAGQRRLRTGQHIERAGDDDPERADADEDRREAPDARVAGSGRGMGNVHRRAPDVMIVNMRIVPNVMIVNMTQKR